MPREGGEGGPLPLSHSIPLLITLFGIAGGKPVVAPRHNDHNDYHQGPACLLGMALVRHCPAAALAPCFLLYPNLSVSSINFSTLNLSSPWANHASKVLLAAALSPPPPPPPGSPSQPP